MKIKEFTEEKMAQLGSIVTAMSDMSGIRLICHR